MSIPIQSDPKQVSQNAAHCKKRNIIIPTFAQLKDPTLIPTQIHSELASIGLWDLHPRNLFRVGWKNDSSGCFGPVNHLELPRELTQVDCRIIGLVGKFFPTGAHKVGAAFGCLVPRLLTGAFNPKKHKAVWPSTGNYCRGGVYISKLLGCESIAILPEEMSQERFRWLESMNAEVIATPGCESNVKEIYDQCWELTRTRGDEVVIFNQFAEFGNGLWHYEVTSAAIKELLEEKLGSRERFFGYVSATGSAGTICAGDRLRQDYPRLRIVASEALQCPTLLYGGFGAHQIEGIGDKHVPWIHNTRNTDVVTAIDDQSPMAIMRLFNEPAGKQYLKHQGIAEATIEQLGLLGISGIANLLSAIKTARWFELDRNEVLVTIFTDSMDLYQSRLAEATSTLGPYDANQAAIDFHCHLRAIKTDHMRELSYRDRKRIHNLKYYTWIEQQKKELEELNTQWYDYKTYWPERFGMAADYDKLITQFNR